MTSHIRGFMGRVLPSLALAASLAACASLPGSPAGKLPDEPVGTVRPDVRPQPMPSPDPVIETRPAPAPPPVQVPTQPLPPSTTSDVPTAKPGPAGSPSTPPTQDDPVPRTEAPAEARDPLRPDVRIDLDDRSARTSLWERIRLGFAMPQLEGEQVRRAERMYGSQPDYVQRMNERGGRYLFHIVEEVQRRGLPTELALLPFVESAFNPEAISSARASGMWQFMPATGRVFQLRQNVFRDDRRDVLASTRAALDYLEKLYGMFGHWHLALAAYNWGEGNVKRAIARQRSAGRAPDYASMKMPNETRFYVPKLQAIKNIVARPGDFGLNLPLLENHPYFLAVSIDRDIDLETAARLAGLPLAEFKALNPQLNRPVILAAGTQQILLPYDNGNTFLKSLAKHRGALASWTAYTVPRTMKSGDVAQQVGMTDEGFRTINHIPPRMLVKAGSTVLVPREGRHADVSAQVADHGSLELAHESPPVRRTRVRVGRQGDTVVDLAKRHGVTPAQVAQWNRVSPTGKLAPGSTIHLELPGRTTMSKLAVASKGKSQRASVPRVSKATSGPKTGRSVAQRAPASTRRR